MRKILDVIAESYFRARHAEGQHLERQTTNLGGQEFEFLRARHHLTELTRDHFGFRYLANIVWAVLNRCELPDGSGRK